MGNIETPMRYIGKIGAKFFLKKINALENALNLFKTERHLKTYTNITQLGMTTDNTLTEIMSAMPQGSVLIHSVGAIDNNLTNSLAIKATAGELRIDKVANNDGGRAIAEFKTFGSSTIYVNHCLNGVFRGWSRLIQNDEFETSWTYRGKLNGISVEDILNLPKGYYWTESSTDYQNEYNLYKYSFLYKMASEGLEGAYMVCHQSGTTNGIYMYDNNSGKFRKLAYNDDLKSLLLSKRQTLTVESIEAASTILIDIEMPNENLINGYTLISIDSIPQTQYLKSEIIVSNGYKLKIENTTSSAKTNMKVVVIIMYGKADLVTLI